MTSRLTLDLESKPLTCGFVVDLLGCYSKRTSWTKRLKRLVSLTCGDVGIAVRRQRELADPLLPSHVTLLVDGYRSGATVKELASRFGIHRTTVTQHLHRNGVALRRRGLDDQQATRAVHLYGRGWSLARVGASLGVDAHTVRAALRARGVLMRDTHGRDR